MFPTYRDLYAGEPSRSEHEFTATITGAMDLAGNPLPTYTWTFTTGATATGLSPIKLGAATNFAAFAGTSITNAGATVVNGDLGLTPGTSVTGFRPGMMNGTIQINNAATAAALTYLATAYIDAAGLSGATTVAENLQGTRLLPRDSNVSRRELVRDIRRESDARCPRRPQCGLGLPYAGLDTHIEPPGCSVILENGAQLPTSSGRSARRRRSPEVVCSKGACWSIRQSLWLLARR